MLEDHEPGDQAPDDSLAAPASDVARRGTGVRRRAVARGGADGLTGLYDGAAWALVLSAEEARWTRFRRPCQVVQVEVAGIASVADRLGEGPAERLLAILSELLREETRESDLYARPSRWRIQGFLPEQESGGGPRYEERVRDGFRRRMGPDLPVGLLVGMATPALSGGLAGALEAAERTMRPGGPAEARPVLAPLSPAPRRDRSTDVRDGLVELALLRQEALVTDEEYRLKRAEILDRL